MRVQAIRYIFQGFNAAYTEGMLLKDGAGLIRPVKFRFLAWLADGEEAWRLQLTTDVTQCGRCNMPREFYDQVDEHYNSGGKWEVREVRELVQAVIDSNTWPGAQLSKDEGGFRDSHGVFTPKAIWDEEAQMPIIASRVKAAEKAIGFKLMRNALWNLRGFNPYRQVMVLTMWTAILLYMNKYHSDAMSILKYYCL
jgi:hypothetical protein